MLKEKLLEDLKNSMKEKNVIRKNVIQMVRAAILQVEKDKQIDKIKILSIAPLFAEAIKRVNEAQPLGDLFDFDK